MSISISAAGSTAGTSPWQTMRQDLGSMISAIKSGNLGAAQQAFTALTGQSLTASGSGSATTTPSAASGNTGADLLATIGQALASGNIAAAQQALTTAFGQDTTSTPSATAATTTAAPTSASSTSGTSGHHHHHRHSSGDAESAVSAPTYSVAPSATSSTNGATGSTISTLA